MLLKTRGISVHVREPIVAKITRDQLSEEPNQILIEENGTLIENPKSFKAVLTNLRIENNWIDIPFVHSVESFEHLDDGDIVVVNSDGVINTFYRNKSRHNFILVTERCNNNCLMCSQPPKDKDDIKYLFDIYRQLIPLIPKDCSEIGITGGEPTLLGESLFELLQLIKTTLPQTDVHCLTNGRAFAWNSIAHRLAEMEYDRLMLGIPLYSDYYQVHDYIVQAKNAFNQTILGLYNLAVCNQKIEIRVVLHKLSVPRLAKLAHYVYQNLPFIEHIAFMGLEYQGYTHHNFDKLWIDPVDYMDELGEATEYLSNTGIHVSIYNLQYCLMPKELWKYSRNSISDWKNVYPDECRKCLRANDCGGLFSSNEKMHDIHLRPFVS